MNHDTQSAGEEFPLYREAYEQCQALEGWNSMSEKEQVAELGKAVEQLAIKHGGDRITRPPTETDDARAAYLESILPDFKKGSDQ